MIRALASVAIAAVLGWIFGAEILSGLTLTALEEVEQLRAAALGIVPESDIVLIGLVGVSAIVVGQYLQR